MSNFMEHIKSWDLLKQEARYSRATILIESILIFVLVIAVLKKDTLVTVIPYNLTEQAYMSQSGASSNVKEAWAYMLASEVGNITQKDYSFIQKRLQPLVSPTIYSDFFKKLEEEVKQIKEDKVVITFAPVLVEYEPSSDKVFVFGRGEVTNSLGYTRVTNRTYEMRFRFAQYVPQLTHFTSYEGEPKDARVLQKLRKAELDRQRREAKARERGNR